MERATRMACQTGGLVTPVEPEFFPLHTRVHPASQQDKVDTIRRQCIGVSAHQKLELLTALVRLCNYDSVAVFGDCFDEVTLFRSVLSARVSA